MQDFPLDIQFELRDVFASGQQLDCDLQAFIVIIMTTHIAVP